MLSFINGMIVYQTNLADLALDLTGVYQISSKPSTTWIGTIWFSYLVFKPNCKDEFLPEAYISPLFFLTNVWEPPDEISIMFDNDGCWIGAFLLSVSPNPNYHIYFLQKQIKYCLCQC